MKKLALSWAMLVAALPLCALQLDGPDFEPINWESRQLTPVDYNSDGREDLSAINGVARAIDVYVQKAQPGLISEPNLATQQAIVRLSRFDKESIALESAPASFAWGRFGGDKDVELAYVSVSDGLSFLKRDAKGTWRVKKRLGELEGLSYTHCLWVGKLTEEGDEVLIGLFKGEIVVLRDYKIVARYPTFDNTPTFLNITDVNRDGRMDIVCEYLSPTRISYRLQGEDGSFASEELVEYASAVEKVFDFNNDTWSFFGGHQSTLHTSVLTPDSRQPKVDFYGLDYAPSAVAKVDVDADGSAEWMVCDPQRGQIDWWKAQKAGFAKAASFPTFKGVADMVWDNQRLWVFSKTERVVGYSSWDAKAHRMSFPKIEPLDYDALGLVEDIGSAWAVLKNNSDFYLKQLGTQTEAKLLVGVKRNPEAMVGFGNADGGFLLALLQPRDAVLLYRVSARGEVTPIKVSAALTANILNNIDKRSLGYEDIDGDGKAELLLASKELLRMFKVTDDSLELVDQALSSSTASRLRLPMMWGDKLWAYDSRHDEFVAFSQDDNGVWMVSGEPMQTGVEALDVMALGKLEWVLLAKNGFFVLKPMTPGNSLESSPIWESDLNIKGYNWGMRENLAPQGSPAQDYYILYSQRERILEFVQIKPDGYKTVLNFKLYDKDIHYSGRKGEDIEPREIVVADVTADGIPDLAMLMHDNLVLYPQSKKEAKK